MTEVIVFPDVAAWAVATLAAGLSDQPDVIPDTRYSGAAKAVWVRRDGGPQLDTFREAARLGVNVLVKTSDGDDKPANDLARLVSALLRAGADGRPVVKVTQSSGPSAIPDQAGPHVYMTFEVWTRGGALS